MPEICICERDAIGDLRWVTDWDDSALQKRVTEAQKRGFHRTKISRAELRYLDRCTGGILSRILNPPKVYQATAFRLTSLSKRKLKGQPQYRLSNHEQRKLESRETPCGSNTFKGFKECRIPDIVTSAELKKACSKIADPKYRAWLEAFIEATEAQGNNPKKDYLIFVR